VGQDGIRQDETVTSDLLLLFLFPTVLLVGILAKTLGRPSHHNAQNEVNIVNIDKEERLIKQ
jgi:hypothetical protein